MKRQLLAGLVFVAASATAADAARFTIPGGTNLRVRLEDTVGSDISRVEDPVRGRVISPLVINGRTVVPAGSTVFGSVTQATRAGKVKGRGALALRFDSLALPGDRERYRIRTATWRGVAPTTRKKDAAEIGLPAAGGAIVGGLVGGGKGAAIGAAAGGGAGTAVVLTTRGKDVRVGPGSVLLVRLSEPLTLHTP